MSLKLRVLTKVMRWAVRPLLSLARNPVRARRNFAIVTRLLPIPPYILHLVDSGPVPLHWISVKRHWTDWVILYLHGGGYIAGSPITHLGLSARIAELTGLQIVSPDYRLAPKHRAPAAFNDVKFAHDQLLAKGFAADHIVLAGDSAGGGLALALLADLCSRGLAPAGLFAFSPWTDLTMTGASLKENADRDPLLPVDRLREAVSMVLGTFDAGDPRVSPVYAEFIKPPPVLLQVGQEEILLDDSRRMAFSLRRAGGMVKIDEWTDCPHVWQMLEAFLPEAQAALSDVAIFVRKLVARS